MFDICQTDYSIHCNHLISYFFYLSFILWIPVYQKVSVIKQCWHVLFFTRIRLVPSVLECNRPIARIKWRRVGVSKGNQSINQSKTIYFTVHKCMIENLLDYLGNKVVFVQMERQWIITCDNLNMPWKMLDWKRRGYHQQLNQRH